MADGHEPLTKTEALKLYEVEGAAAAAAAASVSPRTIQRWASQAGVQSGWEPTPQRGHGTAACYIRGCRRPECIEANRIVNREVKERRIARFKAGQVKIKHGVSGYVNWSCRCADCRNAWSAYLRDRRNSRQTD